MRITESTAGYEVLRSGTLITFDSSAGLKLDVECDETFRFSVVFQFESAEGGGHQLRQNVSNNVVTFRCINFTNSLGTGTTAPIELATFNKKKIYINFWVFSLGGELRKVEYSLYSQR